MLPLWRSVNQIGRRSLDSLDNVTDDEEKEEEEWKGVALAAAALPSSILKLKKLLDEGQRSRRRRPTKAARLAPKTVGSIRRRRLEIEPGTQQQLCYTSM